MKNVWFIYHGWGLLLLQIIAWHTVAYFVNVTAVIALTLGFNKFFLAFKIVWVFVFNVYYGGVSPLGHDPSSSLVWKHNMHILLFYFYLEL